MYPEKDSLVFMLYDASEIHQVSLHEIFSIPEVMVDFGLSEYPLTFDFGNSGNITITTAIADSVKYSITDTTHTYTPDGKIRGQVYDIILPEFQTLGLSFQNESGTLADWSIFSTNPFNGLIGLKYLEGKCFTLSYPRKTLAISDRSIIPGLSNKQHSIIQLENYSMHPYGVHFKGKVNDQEAIIYFDTGKSHSAINQNLVPSDMIASDKSGSFYQGSVEVNLGEKAFTIYYPRVKNLQRDIDSSLAVGIEVGSDILQHLFLSIDRTHDQNLLIIH